MQTNKSNAHLHNTPIQRIKIILHYTIRSIQIIQSQPPHMPTFILCLDEGIVKYKEFYNDGIYIPSFLNFFCLVVIFVKNLKG